MVFVSVVAAGGESDSDNRSLYEVLGSFFHTEMYRVRQTLEAVTADKEIAQMLERKESQPLLKIKAVSYSLEETENLHTEELLYC